MRITVAIMQTTNGTILSPTSPGDRPVEKTRLAVGHIDAAMKWGGGWPFLPSEVESNVAFLRKIEQV